MSNRKSRRRAAAVRRSAQPVSSVERRQLLFRVGLVLLAILAVAGLAIYASRIMTLYVPARFRFLAVMAFFAISQMLSS